MGVFSSIGRAINDLTGASSASSQQQKYSKRLMKIQTDYEREFAQNAHQWEVEDDKKAGINPIHTAGGAGATADAAGASASGISAGQSPIDMIQGISSAKQMLSNAKAQEAETKLKIAQADNEIARNPFIKTREKAEIARLHTAAGLDKANTKLTKEQRARLRKGEITKYLGTGGIFDLWD